MNHFDEFADRYSAWTTSSRAFRERVATFDAVLTRLWPHGGGRAVGLDLGCGNGVLAELAATRNFQVTAVDGSREMIALARQATDVSFRHERLPLHESFITEFEGKADLIIASSVIEYLADTDAELFMTQCRRLLSASGKALLSFPNAHSMYWRVQHAAHVRRLIGKRDFSVQERTWTPDEVGLTARRHGLQVDATHYFALPLQESMPRSLTQRPPWLATLFLAVLSVAALASSRP